MKLASIAIDGGWQSAVVHGDSELALLPPSLGTIDDIVRGGDSALRAVEAVAGSAVRIPLKGAELGSPLRRFNRDLLCSGWNYWDHYEESQGKRDGQDPEKRPEHPTFFTKGPDTVIGPTDPIAFDPKVSEKWDYEAELAIVIGKDGRSIPSERAWEHIFGFVVANDVSQRDLQRAHGGQWLKGKSIDATMPLGPWLTTTDEIPDPTALEIICELNGTVMQRALVAQMAFPIEDLVAELSWGMTLRAGDLVLTGTPSGIGNAREPQVFLTDGDELVTRVAGLGELRNRVTSTPLAEAS